MASTLWGMVMLQPRKPKAAKPASAVSSRSAFHRQWQVGTGQAVQAQPMGVNHGDREWAMGQPITPARRNSEACMGSILAERAGRTAAVSKPAPLFAAPVCGQLRTHCWGTRCLNTQIMNNPG